eukprot:Rmarinus@m.25282
MDMIFREYSLIDILLFVLSLSLVYYYCLFHSHAKRYFAFLVGDLRIEVSHVVPDYDGGYILLDSRYPRVFRMSTVGKLELIAGSGEEGHVDGVGAHVSFASPVCVAHSGAARERFGCDFFVVDRGNNCIRAVWRDGRVETFAGTGDRGSNNGHRFAATFFDPRWIAVGRDGTIFISEVRAARIRCITLDGMVSTYAGTGEMGLRDGPRTEAAFYHPCGIAPDALGNLYVADFVNQVVRKISADGMVSTIAGTSGVAGFRDGAASNAIFKLPRGITADADGNVFVSDSATLRQIFPDGRVKTLLGPNALTICKRSAVYLKADPHVISSYDSLDDSSGQMHTQCSSSDDVDARSCSQKVKRRPHPLPCLPGPLFGTAAIPSFMSCAHQDSADIEDDPTPCHRSPSKRVGVAAGWRDGYHTLRFSARDISLDLFGRIVVPVFGYREPTALLAVDPREVSQPTVRASMLDAPLPLPEKGSLRRQMNKLRINLNLSHRERDKYVAPWFKEICKPILRRTARSPSSDC